MIRDKNKVQHNTSISTGSIDVLEYQDEISNITEPKILTLTDQEANDFSLCPFLFTLEDELVDPPCNDKIKNRFIHMQLDDRFSGCPNEFNRL